jgi:hypothetical protein
VNYVTEWQHDAPGWINVEGAVLRQKTSRQFTRQHFGRSEANTDKPRLQRKRIYEYTPFPWAAQSTNKIKNARIE